MKLTTAAVPDGASDELRRGLNLTLSDERHADLRSRRLESSTGADDVGAGGANDAVATAVPHAVYVAGPADLRSVDYLDRARLKAIRYFVMSPSSDLGAGGVPSAIAEVAVDATTGRASAFSRLNRGRFVEATWRAMQVAERLDEAGSAEVRLFEVPALYFNALWLHRANGPDQLIPLAEESPGLEPFVPYTEAEVRRGLLHDSELASDAGGQAPAADDFPV